MYNWSVDEKYIKKYPKEYKLWKLEQLLSYGLDGEKIDKKDVLKNWEYLKTRLDNDKRNLLEFLLWKKPS